MSVQTSFQPNWVSKPGQTISDILEERNLSMADLAKEMDQSLSFVNKLVEGEIPISPATADKLKKVLGSTADFWLNRENLYRRQVEVLSGLDFEQWLKSLPIKDMISKGWIKNSNNYFQECLSFFNVPDIVTWNDRYVNSLGLTRFRTSKAFDNQIGAVTAWIRQGEIQSNSLPCKSWNPILFEHSMDEIKSLSRLKRPKDFLPQLIRICSECGIAVSIVPTPKGCSASGATKFIDENRALLMLSFRYLADDQFWFTFFHEAGHLLLHGAQRVHIENEQTVKNQDQDEIDANIFAGEILIPSQFHDELRSLKRDKWSIAKFASKMGVSPGIVIGQMQHLGIIKHGYLNAFKRRYNWKEIEQSLN